MAPAWMAEGKGQAAQMQSIDMYPSDAHLPDLDEKKGNPKEVAERVREAEKFEAMVNAE